MDEITLFDKLILSDKAIPNIIEFDDRKIQNYRIIYNGKIIGSLREMILNLNKKIEIHKDDMEKHKEFYTNIIAHLIAYYIIKKINRIDPIYAKFLLNKHKELTEAIYNKLLNGNKDKFEYYGIVWTDRQIENAFMDYIVPRLKPFFKI